MTTIVFHAILTLKYRFIIDFRVVFSSYIEIEARSRMSPDVGVGAQTHWSDTRNKNGVNLAEGHIISGQNFG